MAAIGNLLVQRLREAGVRAIFGVPGGGGNLDLIDAGGAANLPFVLTATETGGAIAAIAQAEVTGTPGACLTTLGPGAASVVNGVACARLERAPIVVFTDSHPVGAHGVYAHQQLDHCALIAPTAKWSGRLEAGTAGRTIHDAFCALATVPAGPVHIDCPGDVTEIGQEPTADDQRETNARQPGDARTTSAGVAGMPQGIELVARARRPLLIVGLGARRADDAAAIRHLIERRRIPAMVTYKAKGVVPDAHECFAGVFTNAAIERPVIEDSDLLIGVGLDPVELLPRPWTFHAPVVGIARWRMADDHVPFRAQLVGDIPQALLALDEQLDGSAWDLRRVRDAVRIQRTSIDIPVSGLSAQRVIDVAAEALAPTHRVTVDAGAHMFPATMRWAVGAPNGMLISNGLSTMGFALPAAIGAARVDPTPVVALTGDGGLLMCAGELLTAARERLRVIVIVFNDASLSLIEIKQQARRLRPAGVALGNVRWRALAEGFGMPSFEAASDHELAGAIGQALDVDGPSLIEARIDRSNYSAMMRVVRG
jgi:acetolactate synthase-1/2/3 large subunit